MYQYTRFFAATRKKRTTRVLPFLWSLSLPKNPVAQVRLFRVYSPLSSDDIHRRAFWRERIVLALRHNLDVTYTLHREGVHDISG